VSDVAAAIRARRKALGWSQRRLAEAAGISRAGLTMRELGKTAVTVGELIRIAAALETTAAALLGEPQPEATLEPAPSQPGQPSQPSTIAETCRCGGSTTVTAPTLGDVCGQVERWRTGHLGCQLSTPHGAGFRVDRRPPVGPSGVSPSLDGAR
jgi:DNA-binding XRE family transcriptional regulator